VVEAYDNFEFYKIYHLVHNFCSVELSSFYLDVAKDLLYTSKKDSQERRCIQTVMYSAIDAIIKLMAPIIPFTTEETWGYMLEKNVDSIHLASMPEIKKEYINPELDEKWTKILGLREQVAKVIEEKRKNKVIGHSLDTDVKLSLPSELYKVISGLSDELASIFIVSNVHITEGKELAIEVNKSDFNKCARCWQYKKEVGQEDNKELCKRCLNAIS
jgi:isoleucyl-tRNA synthetase